MIKTRLILDSIHCNKLLCDADSSEVVVIAEELTDEQLAKVGKMQKTSGIHILSDKDLDLALLVNGEPVAAVWTNKTQYQWSADFVTNPMFSKRGYATKLLEMIKKEFYNFKVDFPEAIFILDIVSPQMEKVAKSAGFYKIEPEEGAIEKNYYQLG